MLADSPSEIDIFDIGLEFATIMLLFLDSAPIQSSLIHEGSTNR